MTRGLMGGGVFYVRFLGKLIVGYGRSKSWRDWSEMTRFTLKLGET